MPRGRWLAFVPCFFERAGICRLIQKASLQFRAEAFNFTNTVQFARPNYNLKQRKFLAGYRAS